MAFQSPSKILEKITRFKLIKIQDDKLVLAGVPGSLSPLYVTAYFQRLLEKCYGKKKTMDLLYNAGRFQGRQAFRIFSKRFGYAEKIKDKKELLEFQTSQSIVIGHGKFEWVKIDFENNVFIIRGKSTYGDEYKRFFGLQKEPIDYFHRGLIVSFIEELTKRKMLCIETQCIAQGKTFCEYVVRPYEKWEKKDMLVKNQIITNLPDIKELGAQIDPYLDL